MENFSYDEYEQVRERLVCIVRESLTKQDKDFLLSVKNLTPDWLMHDFERFPSVQWKLLNLRKLRDASPERHRAQYEALKKALDSDSY